MRVHSTAQQTKAAARPLANPGPILMQALFALGGGVALCVLFILAAVVGYELAYAGKVYPGVSVAGVDLSGLEPAEAAARLSAGFSYPETGKLVFKEGDRLWVATPEEIGLSLDAENSVLAAYSFGRHGNWLWRAYYQFEAWYSGTNLPPVLVYDEWAAQNYVGRIAAVLNRPLVEASLKVTGVNVEVVPGQIGRTVDVAATLAPLTGQLQTLTDGILPVVVEEAPPAILDVSEQAEAARQILSEPLVLTLPGDQDGTLGPWTFAKEELAAMLVIDRVEDTQGARYEVAVDTEKMRPFLQELAPKLSRKPKDARFVFNDETRQLEAFENSIVGRSLDVDATLQAVKDQVMQGEHSASLVMELDQPAVSDQSTAEQLGVTELVSEQTTYFYGSDEARLKNIETAASRFHGVMVPPGATFSMGDVLGDVSLDTGYAEAWIIYGDRTIKGVGGGVCQVSTTLFRTVFFGGFPIVERHSHAYRVTYYEQVAGGRVDGRLAGLDATVYFPVVDFKFTNDTPHWLLMETYFNKTGRSLTWKFYSTSDGRTVDWTTTGLQNRVEPPEPVYHENEKLAKGVIKQVDWAVEGADVTVNRTVMRDGVVYFEDVFKTHYIPWRDVYEYGPGTKLPKNANTGGDED